VISEIFPQSIMFLLLLTFSGAMGDCIVNPDSDFPQWPAILTNEVGDIVLPTGGEDNRQVAVPQGETVVLSCPGGEFDHEAYWGSGPIFATCEKGAFDVSSEAGEPDPGLSYSDLGCRSQPLDSAVIMEQSAGCGPDGVGTEIQIGFDTDPLVPGIETTTLTVCHDLVASRTLYSHHTLFDEINARDHGNDSPADDNDVGKEVRNAIDNELDILVTVLSACGEECVIATKVNTAVDK